MADFRILPGFEEAWRPPVGRRRLPEEVLSGPVSRDEIRARLARLAAKAPEVVVKVAGRTKGAAHLQAHLNYISRRGELALEGPDGWPIIGRAEVRELADDWSAIALADSRRRVYTPFTRSLVLSMPNGTDPFVVRDAARAFAASEFAGRFDHVFVLHTDEAHPHVHMAIRALGYGGERLNPKHADLAAWRQLFARELRERGVEAEATPRRARGVTRKAERGPIRRMREGAEAGRRAQSRVQRGAMQAAAQVAFGGDAPPRPWEERLVARQQRIRGLYLAQARLLQASSEAADRELGQAVEAFVRGMPAPDTQLLALARALREANERLAPEPGRTRDRSR